MLALTRADVQRLAPMPDVIELMKTAFAELSAGRVASPLRTVIPVKEHKGDALFMPAHVPALDALGLKAVCVYKENPAKGLPVIHALVCLIDAATGQPLAIMDGTYMTALRTGAVSGAATDLLARPDSKTLAVVGAGAQGATQIAAVCAVRPIERVIAVNRTDASNEKLRTTIARDWPDLLDRIEVSTDANTAVGLADIVCTASSSRTPVFDAANVRPGAHVNAVGAYTPEMQELPADLVVRATVTLDAVDAALSEAGDFIIPINQGLVGRDHFTRELGMVASGAIPGRQSPEEITLFKSVGNAVQDVVVARQVYDQAIASGAGIAFDLG